MRRPRLTRAAQQEAQAPGSPTIEAEHLLLALAIALATRAERLLD